jgi:hypothetical protein
MTLCACETQKQEVAGMQPQAVEAALSRGKFDLGCPEATAQMLSNEAIQQRYAGPIVGAAPQRAEYTVGVEGCGKRATYVVVCAEGGTGCVAAEGRNEVQQSNSSDATSK